LFCLLRACLHPWQEKQAKRAMQNQDHLFKLFFWGVKICTFFVKAIFQNSFLAKFAPNMGLTDFCGEFFDRQDTRIFGKGKA